MLGIVEYFSQPSQEFIIFKAVPMFGNSKLLRNTKIWKSHLCPNEVTRSVSSASTLTGADLLAKYNSELLFRQPLSHICCSENSLVLMYGVRMCMDFTLKSLRLCSG